MSARSSEVKSRARLSLLFESEEEAELAASSVEPDNEPLPRGLELVMEREGSRVEVVVLCDRTLASLLTTLDDLLSMMLLSLKVARRVG